MLKNNRASKRQLRRVRLIVILVIIMIVCLLILFGLKSPMFNVAEVEVDGNHYYSDAEIIAMANCSKDVNIFNGVDCKDIRKRLLKDPYMEQVTVKRKLPDTISIEIKEREQVAGIVYGSSFVVIDIDGIVLRKTSVDPKVTVLKGMNISKMTLGDTIEVEEEVLLRQCMDIIRAMKEHDMYFKSITIQEGLVKAYVLDNLVVEGMADNIVSALKNDEIQLVVQELFKQKIERGTIKVTGDSYVSYTPKID
ncbi:MAG: FtsQ-type POTRA domain-containing protein [Firmicutes bacterium]|nr:FtsQ-type POTRA domain-containing protein [Bacillota bacterium]